MLVIYSLTAVTLLKKKNKFSLSLHFSWVWAVCCYGSRRQRKMYDFVFVECKVPDLGAPLERLVFPRCFQSSFFFISLPTQMLADSVVGPD